MIVKPWVILFVGLLLLTGTASADPFNSLITVTSNKEWVVANGVDQTTISVNVKYASNSTNVPDAVVTFVVDSQYGSIPSVTTDAGGNAVSTFKVGKKSGIAVITANAEYTDGGTVFTSTTPGILNQNIDHDIAYKANFVYLLNGTVKSSVPFDTYVLDRWNNPVDSRRPSEIHNLTLHVHGPGADDCGFEDGGLVLHDIKKTLDATGHTSLMVNLTSKPGVNTIMTDRMDSMNNQYKTIEAIANGIPYTISAEYSPTYGGDPRQQASNDPSKIITARYTLYDYFGNPTRNQSVWVNTSYGGIDDLQILVETDSFGRASVDYGPKNVAGTYSMTATAANNNAVTTSKDVMFQNAAPTNLELSASPQSVPSLDANPSIFSNISAKVVDDFGNPVGGQLVTFEISEIRDDCSGTCVDTTANANGNPSFENPGIKISCETYTSGVGSDLGIATVKLYPGSFKTAGMTGYKSTATGNATVTATWNGVSQDAQIIWKNYPYLSAVTKISPNQVKVGDTVDVNLKLNGDGWKLAKNPIDVSLAVDTSGSMAEDMGGTVKLDAAKTAATNFVNSMSAGDRVGLVGYGESAKFKQNLTTDRNLMVNTRIPSLSSNGYTPTRQALLYSISDLIDHPNADPKTVRAVILMTDGEFNYYGDPLGRGTAYSSSLPQDPQAHYDYWSGTWHSSWYEWDHTHIDKYTIFPSIPTQDMSELASSNNIRIYTISFTETKDDTTNTWKTMDTISSNTKGKHYWAGDAATLNTIYQEIAGELREEAGVDTTADLNFGTVLINNAWDTSGAAFEYVGDPENPGLDGSGTPAKGLGSTMLDKYNATHHQIPGNGFTNIGPVYQNQTDYWNTHSKHLYFDVGTVKLGETWETNFRLRVLKEGSYTLFSPDSCINFKDSEGNDAEPLCLGNQSSFTASFNPVINPLNQQSIALTITDIPSGTEIVTDFPVKFSSTYSGAEGNTVYVDIYYVHDTDPRVLVSQQQYTQPAPPYTKDDLQANFPLASKPVGQYHYYIHAYAVDAEGEVNSAPREYTTSDKNFIKLE